MKNQNLRSIDEVLNIETGEYIDANIFFSLPIDEVNRFRSELDRSIQNKREKLFICPFCREKIRIRGNKSSLDKRRRNILHFAHLRDSPECHIKTNNGLTKEEVDIYKYYLIKESLLHKELKKKIAECLELNKSINKGVSAIDIERVVKSEISKEWKRPDVQAQYFNKKIAIELQLSTTWISVITKRQEFYRNEKTFIFWLFHRFDENDKTRRQTYNDIIFTNHQNAFIFDLETYKLSKLHNDLIFKCYFKEYYIEASKLKVKWSNKIINLSDLTFNTDLHKIYYHDADTQKIKLNQEIEELEKSKAIKIAELSDTIQLLENQLIEFRKIELDITVRRIKHEGKLNHLNSIVGSLSNCTKRAIDHFVYNSNYNPFSEFTNIYNDIKLVFSDNCLEYFKSLDNSKNKLKKTLEELNLINSFEKIEISNKVYQSIDNKSDWKFIIDNFDQISILHKKSRSDLYAESEFKKFFNEFELGPYKYSKNLLFLVTISEKYNNLITLKEDLDILISDQEQNIESIKLKLSKDINDLIQIELITTKHQFEELCLELKIIENKIIMKTDEINSIREKIGLIKFYN